MRKLRIKLKICYKEIKKCMEKEICNCVDLINYNCVKINNSGLEDCF